MSVFKKALKKQHTTEYYIHHSNSGKISFHERTKLFTFQACKTAGHSALMKGILCHDHLWLCLLWCYDEGVHALSPQDTMTL